MKFRPCIDIHNGKVKQIVGGSLSDTDEKVKENFISDKNASYYGKLYKELNLKGGHVIMLTPSYSKHFNATKNEALEALKAYPGGMQVGGGINADNAKDYLDKGASHVIITSWFFENGAIRYDRMEQMRNAIGKERIVVDLSCRYRDNGYYVVTDRWQTFTDVRVSNDMLIELSDYCDEFLIHGVDVEGKGSGMEEPLVELLTKFDRVPITYAGGIASKSDVGKFETLSNGKLDFTVGSALDIFSGKLPFEWVKRYNKP
ncbi:MAG: phosphoribosylformimino-5-aminoimidazole carboxamide ribotide isomerase [Suipraeoptans sp.]